MESMLNPNSLLCLDVVVIFIEIRFDFDTRSSFIDKLYPYKKAYFLKMKNDNSVLLQYIEWCLVKF